MKKQPSSFCTYFYQPLFFLKSQGKNKWKLIKGLAEAMKELNEKVSEIDPSARKNFDRMLNQYGQDKK